jgi:hypothetical protein
MSALLLPQLKGDSTNILVAENAVLDCATKCSSFETTKQCDDYRMKCVPGNPSGGMLKPFDCISVEVIDDDIDYNSQPGTFQPSLAESNHSLTGLLTTGNL